MPAIPACFSGAKPLTAEAVCAGHAQRAGLVASDAGLFWLEMEPSSGKARPRWFNGARVISFDTLDAGIGSRVNGYGGGSMVVLDRYLVMVTEDQQVVSLAIDTSGITPLTAPDGSKWGGLVADPAHNRVLAVREHNQCQTLVAIDLDGNCQQLHQGEDFYGAPVISGDGRQMAWISWQLPDMPWHRSSLWLADVHDGGGLGRARKVLPPSIGSIQQPTFHGRTLHVLSDHAGWWQPWVLAQWQDPTRWTALSAPDLDHANAPWQLGERHHCVLKDGHRATVRYNQGAGELWLIRPDESQEIRVAENFTDFRALSPQESRLFCIARSDHRLDAIIEITPETQHVRVLAGGETPLAETARPETFCVPASGDCEFPVHGFLYRPRPTHQELVPLILMAHGGPTSAAYPVYNPQIQFWCQRGFAVAEVNYRGSSGFGRAFRETLAGNWGVHDVQDMERAARHLAEQGEIDSPAIFIQGRSSGGYTALMALIASDRFSGGASLFGVTDPWRLRQQTHRFESGYLDWLLGHPADHDQRWVRRTPCEQATSINAPVVFFQGGQDTVVVPEQTRSMVRAIEAAGGRAELHWFELEGHGFRCPDNQVKVLNELHDFYQCHRRIPP
ncbi:MAG: S9 family peptidase [Alteromonadaceae bacterium]|nr:S9 family peptidase [Alteromonadaceae bacterium]